ncbi:MAG TPA: hypothetical protein P5077_00135 [bacterium]|nr:hypothetical protein [bacterium]
MPLCTVTGIEMMLNEAYVLDLYEIKRAVRECKNRLAALERLERDYGTRDVLERKQPGTGRIEKAVFYRLVCESAAAELSRVYPSRRLFLRFDEFLYLRRRRIEDSACRGQNDQRRESPHDEGGGHEQT